MKKLVHAVVIFLIASSTAAQEPPQNSANKPRPETCSISGMVVKLASSVPLKSATVLLENAEERERTASTVTDLTGRFQLRGVAPGHYRLLVGHNGFVTQEYGQRAPGDPGSTLTLAPGQQMKDLVFRLIPSAVITGRILNEDGEPLPWTEVSALREIYSEGSHKLGPGAYAQTNDLGEYRLFGLTPGQYFVKAVYKRGSNTEFEGEADARSNEKSVQGYVPEYYPGSPELAKATSLTLKAGEEVSSIDILLRPVSVFSVRGHVYNAVTKRPGMGAILELVPRSSRMGWARDEAQQVLTEKRDGSFEFSDVLPGSYILAMQWSDENKRYQARQNVDVGNANVEGVSLTIAPGMTITGHVIWDGKPSLGQDELSVIPSVADSVGSSLFFGEGATVAADGTFSLKNISEGTYQVRTYGESPDCYLKAVRYGATDALENGFTVQHGTDASLEVTLSSRGARVQGTVADADGLPLAGVWAVLVPEEAHRSQMQMYKVATTDQYGHFELRGIPPGDYKLFSWEEVENGAWQDPEFLKPFEAKGEEIRLQEGDQKTANLTAIKTKTPEQEKP